MNRYTVDHWAGDHGRGAVLFDSNGGRVLGMSGDWAVTNDEGRTTIFLSPDIGGILKDAVVGGIVSGIIGSDPNVWAGWRNTGVGVQTVKRATRPVRGIPIHWTPLATVSRSARQPGEIDRYFIQAHDATLPPVQFEQRADAAELAGYANGFGDPRWGVFDLLRGDGMRVLRHWATIDKDLRLQRSTFDVEDAEFPLDVAVMLCLARYRSWRY